MKLDQLWRRAFVADKRGKYLALPVERIGRVLSPRQGQLILQRKHYWIELFVGDEKMRRNPVKSICTICGDQIDKSLMYKYELTIGMSFVIRDTSHYDVSLLTRLKKWSSSL